MTQSPPAAVNKQGSPPLPAWFRKSAALLAFLLPPAVALHGWPAGDVPAMRFFWPANLLVILWLALMSAAFLSRPARSALDRYWPPACMWVFLAICLLSIAASANAARAATSVTKTALFLLGAYALIRAACDGSLRIAVLPWLSALAVSGVILHAATELRISQPPVACFDSPLKLGSFLAMTVPFAASYLAVQPSIPARLWATALVIGSLIVCASAWAWLGIVTGIVAGTATRPTRRWLAATLFIAAAAVTAAVHARQMAALISDIQWREDSGTDVRQRYLEWQALVNLLEDRGGAGTGSGCLNDHRSEYYRRLPKNNTIAAFDQNGYLAVAAELGFPGLIALCWIMVDYLARGRRLRGDPVGRAASAGIVGAAVANLASSLFFNGILVVFVVLLAVLDHRERAIANATA